MEIISWCNSYHNENIKVDIELVKIKHNHTICNDDEHIFTMKFDDFVNILNKLDNIIG